MPQMVEYLLSKYKVLSSTPGKPEKKKIILASLSFLSSLSFFFLVGGGGSGPRAC
jgi:hypothetical protein